MLVEQPLTAGLSLTRHSDPGRNFDSHNPGLGCQTVRAILSKDGVSWLVQWLLELFSDIESCRCLAYSLQRRTLSNNIAEKDLHSLAVLFSSSFPPVFATTPKPPYLLEFYAFEKLRTVFGFLRHVGPRRLGPSRHIILDQEEYQITQIGRGAFATISRVLHKPSGDLRVMKRIRIDNSGLAKSLAEIEIEALTAMKGNKWFPVLLNHFKDDEEFIITMPFYRRGDMAGLIEHKGYLGRQLAQFYCAELVIAIQYLHKQGIVHRDIKPANIFLDDVGHLILGDFGLAENIATYEGGDSIVLEKFPAWVEARKKGGDDFPWLWADDSNPLSTQDASGTRWHTAPEVFRKERYSFGVDYWSVGVLYHELITGCIPFNNYIPYPEDGKPELDFRRAPGQVKGIESWEKIALTAILASDPKDRPQTVTAIKASVLFAGIVWEKLVQLELLPPPLPQPLLDSA